MIRLAAEEDLASIAALHRASITLLCRDHYTGDQLAAWTSALHPGLYARLLTTHQVLVRVDGETLSGFGVFDPAEALINATYVAPRSARQGVGRSLVVAMEAAAQASGATLVHLNATLNAVGFYEALGYSQAGTSCNRLPTGVELPCVVMNKRVRRPAPAPGHQDPPGDPHAAE